LFEEKLWGFIGGKVEDCGAMEKDDCGGIVREEGMRDEIVLRLIH
jgi:hypothetical protein